MPVKKGEKKARHVNLPARPEEAPEVRTHRLLSALDQDKIDSLVAKMVHGEKLVNLVDLIQKEWGMLTDTQPATLMVALSRFRKDRVVGKLLWMKDTEYGQEAARNFGTDIDALDNLKRLIQIQQERVSKGYMQEANMKGVLMDGLRKEILLLSNMYANLLTLQMDMGIVRRVPKEHLVASVEVAASKAGQAIEDALARDKKVGETLSKAFRILEGEFSVLPEKK